ncbi:unnamed protein product [Dovyalis caffra]|uniref:B-like cyclin n=1 Tax=Dovyalis caffra TaxID=77055 RepID=A0AAV1S9C7_9ROSI|nr:unnamed protein product [Dovyalis caffra]
MASGYNPETSAVQEQQQYQQNPTFLYDALYCSEENWEEEVSEDYFQDEVEGESYYSNKQNTSPILLEQDLSWEDEELSSLFAKEEQNQLYKNLETNPSLARARCKAVEWILKVNAHYSFAALTAVLAVNYLDRFLFSVHLQKEKPWMGQLSAVACLSLAAKVEETEVPLLLDFQVEDSKYVFEANTIQRMEILDKVEDCSKLVMELAPRDQFKLSNKRKLCSVPGSPDGVIDVSFSSDSSNDSWSVVSSVTSSPEPLSKKSRALQSLNNATSDFCQHSSLVP